MLNKKNNMLSIFKRKSKKEKLVHRRQRLLKEAHTLSTVNRTLSDQMVAEANEIDRQILALEQDGATSH